MAAHAPPQNIQTLIYTYDFDVNVTIVDMAAHAPPQNIQTGTPADIWYYVLHNLPEINKQAT